MAVKRGETWWAQLDEPVGSGPGYRRPVLILQADGFNRSALRTVIVAAITSNLALAMAPGNVRLPKPESGLGLVSVVNVSQLLTVDRAQLLARIGALAPARMQQIDAGLRAVLAL